MQPKRAPIEPTCSQVSTCFMLSPDNPRTQFNEGFRLEKIINRANLFSFVPYMTSVHHTLKCIGKRQTPDQ